MTTTQETDPTVTISLHYRDAQKYVRNANHPAHPEVLARVRGALEAEPWASRVDVTVSLDAARTFIRKSNRPIRLWSGQTMKSLLEMAVAEYDEEHPSGTATIEVPVPPDLGDDPDGDATLEPTMGDVVDDQRDRAEEEYNASLLREEGEQLTELKSHPTDPDQEPSPVADERETPSA